MIPSADDPATCAVAALPLVRRSPTPAAFKKLERLLPRSGAASAKLWRTLLAIWRSRRPRTRAFTGRGIARKPSASAGGMPAFYSASLRRSE